jgi:beta-lactamase superfamily II metal-dependent hydrolase
MPDRIDYVSKTTARWDVIRTGTPPPAPRRKELLWGDQVVVTGPGRTAGEVTVKARGQTGFVAEADLGGEPLLEIYFIDVGQGDGVLIVTPERKHVFIDGGWPRRGQPSGKNAADFVDWKFSQDYGRDRMDLDAVICSHNDQDHYGGLWDLFNPTEAAQLRIPTSRVFVEQFLHAGVSWWTLDGRRSLGRVTETSQGKLLTDLISSRASVLAGLAQGAVPRLQGEWASFLRTATNMKTRDGAATPFTRLSHVIGHVPGFEPGAGSVAMRVLAPVEFTVDGKPGVRRFSSEASKNTNGNSVLLRLDYKRSRTLLTGDLNKASQHALLADYAGERHEFQADVAKACHHGSEDVSYEFLQGIAPAVTIISSGDNEGHDHPRPSIVAASATAGFLRIEHDEVVSPLIYSTELARSLKLGRPTGLTVGSETPPLAVGEADLGEASVSLAVTNAGDRNPTTWSRRLGGSRVVAGIIYGLVNVRTDGDRILCATMNEAEHTWEVKTLRSRF